MHLQNFKFIEITGTNSNKCNDESQTCYLEEFIKKSLIINIDPTFKKS